MDYIHYNPYRVAGVYSNATTREIQKNQTKIKRYAEIGKSVHFPVDFKFLKGINRDSDLIKKSFSKLQQGPDKFQHSLFWFLNIGIHDATAINFLENGNKEKAKEIWIKLTEGKSINSKSFSYFHNLGTLKLLSDSLEEIQDGVLAKTTLIESDYFSQYLDAVSGDTFVIDKQEATKILIDHLISEFKGEYSGSELGRFFEKCNGTTHAYLEKKLSGEHINQIDFLTSTTKKKRKQDKNGTYELGKNLFLKTRSDLKVLKGIFQESDIQYKNIADNLAKEILQCGIDYFQHWKEVKDPSKESLELIKLSKSIAVSNQVLERIEDNWETIENWAKTAPIQKELSFITKELSNFQTLKDSPSNARKFLAACKPKLEAIRSILGHNNETYLNISTAVINNAQGMLISAVNDEQELFQLAIDSNTADKKRIGEIAFKRSNGTEEDVKRQIQSFFFTDKHNAYNSLKSVLRDALSVSKNIGTFDMNYEAQNRYKKNHSALESLASQAGIYSTSGPSRPIKRTSTTTTNTSGNSSSSSNEDNSGCIWFVVAAIIVGIILIANS
jgi:hypothetical protein